MHCIALHSATVHCIALHCTALHCTALHCIAVHCTALHFTTVHCIALHCITLHCTALHFTTVHFTALHCIALHYSTLHCTAMQCNAMHCTALHSAQLTSNPVIDFFIAQILRKTDKECKPALVCCKHNLFLTLLTLVSFILVANREFFLEFPARQNTSFVETVSLPSLNEFTLCFWMRRSFNGSLKTGIMSYATTQTLKSLFVFLGVGGGLCYQMPYVFFRIERAQARII